VRRTRARLNAPVGPQGDELSSLRMEKSLLFPLMPDKGRRVPSFLRRPCCGLKVETTLEPVRASGGSTS